MDSIQPGPPPPGRDEGDPSRPLFDTPRPVPAFEAAAPGAGLALALLLAINLFNYIDRQVLAAVEPDIRLEFFPDDPQGSRAGFLTGLLSTAFLLTYMFTAPLFGWLANKMSRWVLIGIGVTLWSLASGGSGLASRFWTMFATRCFVGVGEAVYGPVAPAMIADLYPVSQRGAKLAWFYAAIPFGGALGYALGDLTTRATGHWSWAFLLVVPPGLVLGALCWFMPEPVRGRHDRATRTSTALTWNDYLVLLWTPSYVLNTLGMTAMTFAMGGLAFHAADYLRDRGVGPVFGVPPTTFFGALTALTGLAATLLGGLAGDRLKPYFGGSYFLVSGAAMLAAFPLLLLVIYLPFPLAWVPLGLFVFFLFFNTAPTNAILANVTHPLLRAPGFAINILVIHLFGDAVSPPLMGWVKGLRRNPDDAFLVVSGTVLVGGLLWLWGARYLAHDTAVATRRLEEPPPVRVN